MDLVSKCGPKAGDAPPLWVSIFDTFSTLFRQGVFESALVHLFFHYDCFGYLFGSILASETVPFGTRICEAPTGPEQRKLRTLMNVPKDLRVLTFRQLLLLEELASFSSDHILRASPSPPTH